MACTLFIAAIFVGWGDRDQWTNISGAIYFSVGTGGVIAAYVAHVRSLVRIRRETGILSGFVKKW